MRILWVGTKSPAPPDDGGRLVALLTLEALRAQGHELTVVAPIAPREADYGAIVAPLERVGRLVLVPGRPVGLLTAAVRATLGARPLTIVRHAVPAVRREVARLLAAEAFDAVHAEQPQALAQVVAAPRQRVPVVLRAQNVESDLWREASRAAGPLRLILAREARHLAAFEGRAVRATAATVALTADDAAHLAALAGDPGRVHHVPAPFPARLPAATRPLAGNPAVVLFGSAGWRPNEEASRWFRDVVWPRVRAALPQAVLHVFGEPVAPSPDLVPHPAPAESREAYAVGSVLVVPLRVASGVRMKILEAWARGVPVLSTPTGARGLEATDGRELLLANDPDGFVRGLRRLHAEPGLALSLNVAGRRRLEESHRPESVASRLASIYGRVASSGRQ